MNCYVCGTARPADARYCPGCGRYCADDPNVPKTPVLTPETLVMEEPVLADAPAAPAPCPDVPISEPESPQPDPTVKRKKRRPILIPVLIMAGLFLVGTAGFLMFPYDAPSVLPTGTEDIPAGTTAPTDKTPYQIPLPRQKSGSGKSTDSTTQTLPAADAGCFRIANGAVSFLPDQYDGSPILVIPSEIDGQTVTAIAENGFSGLEGITTLILPDTLTRIGDHAFENCPDLRGVKIPDQVKSIGRDAFRGCIRMESISIPSGVTIVGADAFDGCACLMYIFYDGSYEQWMALYNEYITPFTYACCSDGEYYHGAYTP